jgi:hypothetical protein
MKCEYCNKDGLEWYDFSGPEGMCDDCFDKMIDEEAKQHCIFDEQDGKCFLCGSRLSGWIIKEDKAICWPSCDNKLRPAIEITINDFL